MNSREQEIIDEETKSLRKELNEVIEGTVPYKYGDFRFRVRKASNGEYTFITAREDWDNKFGDEFRAIARKHGWRLKYVRSKGYYWLLKDDESRRGNDVLVFKGKTIDEWRNNEKE